MSPSLGSRPSLFCAFQIVPATQRVYNKHARQKPEGVDSGTQNARRLNALPVVRIKRLA